MNDKQIVDIVAQLYSNQPIFDDLLWPEADNGVCVGLKRVDDIDLIVFRGSTTTQDFLRDFFAIPLIFEKHAALGTVHAGFLEGMDAAFAHLRPLLRQRVVVSGHSLGAARASLFAGLLAAEGGALSIEVVVFGEPRSGCGRLQRLLQPYPYRSYRTTDGKGRHDLVTDVPTAPPYSRNRELIDLYAMPPDDDPWGPFAFHHIQLYQAALEGR